MPRKKEIKWLSIPRADLTKCHNKRCEENAAQDFLCSDHWVTWQQNGRMPAMPRTYAGGAPTSTQSPLQVELSDLSNELDLLSTEVASLRVDDAEGLATLEAAKRHVAARIEELRVRQEQALAPFIEAQRKTSRIFEQVGNKASRALNLINTRTEVAKTSIRPLAGPSTPRRRPEVNVVRRKAGARR